MSKQKLGKLLLGTIIILTVFVVLLADVFNTHHLYNETWPPHAKLHNAMQALMLIVVSAASLLALLAAPQTKAWMAVSCLAPMSFWPGLVVAPLIEGTSLYASDELKAIGFPINFVLAIVFIILTLIAYKLVTSKSSSPNQGK